MSMHTCTRVLTFLLLHRLSKVVIWVWGALFGDAVTALKAAEVVCNDVAAIDINMGCPKHFSTSGGMGSKLLKEPEKVPRRCIISHF
jgi:tRNA-dihydrouridine synthase